MNPLNEVIDMRSQIKLISFDVWDTLLRLDPMVDALSRGIGNVINLDPEKVRKAIFETYREVKPLLLIGELEDWEVLEESQRMLAEKLNASLEEIRRGISRGIAELDVESLLFPDVRKSLKELSEKVHALCIIGNVTFWPGSFTRMIFEKLDLAKFFKVQLYSDEFGVAKPDKSIFLEACGLCEVEVGEALHVGDNPFEDIGGALSAGMRAALLRRDLNDVKFVDELAVAIIPSLESLPQILEHLGRLKTKIPWIR